MLTALLRMSSLLFACTVMVLGLLALTGPSYAQANRLQMNQSLSNLNLDAAPENRSVVPQGRSQLSLSTQQRRTLQRLRGGSLNFACTGGFCACHGDADCNDMFTTNVCGPTAVCIGSYCFCDRAQ